MLLGFCWLEIEVLKLFCFLAACYLCVCPFVQSLFDVQTYVLVSIWMCFLCSCFKSTVLNKQRSMLQNLFCFMCHRLFLFCLDLNLFWFIMHAAHASRILVFLLRLHVSYFLFKTYSFI